MPLHSININKIRENCRSRIESIEIWLRRIVTEELTKGFGADFINVQLTNGAFLIKKDIRDNINNRYSSNRDKLPRAIDAAFFENLADIFCNPSLYGAH